VKRARAIAALACVLLAAGCSNPFKTFSEQPVKVDAALLKQIGLPLYPGARPTGPGGMKMHMEVKGSAIETLTVITTSTDPVSEVDAWYETRLPPKSKLMNWRLGSTSMIEWETIGRDGTVHQVQVTGSSSQTQITLTRTVVSKPVPSSAPTATGR
jgi:hypothetical protein